MTVISSRGRAALMAALLTGCGEAPAPDARNLATPALSSVSLPEDSGERAASCYAARVLQFEDAPGPLTVEQANEAAHFVLLGASTSGITEPTKVDMLQQVAQGAIPAIRQTGRAADTLRACKAAYPATGRAFAGLAADSRDTRMQCFSLAMVMGQIYAQSPQIVDPRVARYERLYDVLDDRMTAELRPQAGGNLVEIAGLATRSMSTALELGPITPVLDACAARYAS